jgi:hypothetical protein
MDVREWHGRISALDHGYLFVPSEGSAPHEPRMTSEHGPPHAGKSPAHHHFEQGRASLASKYFEIHVDAGERRTGRFRHYVPIVEADHRYVPRDGETHLAQGFDRAASVAEQRVGRVLAPREQFLCGLATPSLRPAAGQGWQRRQAASATAAR